MVFVCCFIGWFCFGLGSVGFCVCFSIGLTKDGRFFWDSAIWVTVVFYSGLSVGMGHIIVHVDVCQAASMQITAKHMWLVCLFAQAGLVFLESPNVQQHKMPSCF